MATAAFIVSLLSAAASLLAVWWAKRSARAAQQSADVAKADHELRVALSAAHLEIADVSVDPSQFGSVARLSINNHGGGPAYDVRLGEARVGDTYYRFNALPALPQDTYEILQGSSQAPPSPGQPQQAEAVVSYRDSGGPHSDVPLKWRRR